jgi:nucleotide-binding universal stress UspA family protein
VTEQPPSPAPAQPGPILVGVVPGQPAVVVQHAAELARDTGARLVLVYVDVTMDSGRQPIDPDGVDDDAADIAAGLREQIAAQLAGTAVGWSFEVLTGEPVHELLRRAAEDGASAIVVGSKEPGLGRFLETLTGGSFGERLARHGGPPVLVVPLPAKPGAAP